MKATVWDQLWRGSKAQILWSQPDEDVVGLLPLLERENVRRVLDLGCGLGRHVVHFAKAGFEVHDVDSSDYAIEHCSKWLEAENLSATVAQGEMRPLGFQDRFFDFVISSLLSG